MDELTALINQIKSDPESMRQIQGLASSLGLGSSAQPSPPPATSQSSTDLSALSSLLGSLGANPQPTQPNPAPDLSALSGLLGSLGASPQPAQPNPAPDLSALSGLLGSLGSSPQPAQPNPAPDLSALTALLGGGKASHPSPAGMLSNIDINVISRLSSALSSMQNNRANVDLLLALKPRLKEDRSKKVDDAIRVMQLIQFLPLIKESGLFGEMDNILGGLAGGRGLGGLSGLLGNVGGGLSGLLGGLGRR